MDSRRFEYLQQQYLAGQASPDELAEFRALVQAGHFEDVVKKGIATSLETDFKAQDNAPEDVDADALFARIMERAGAPVRKTLPLARIWYAAAALLVGLGLGWYAWQGAAMRQPVAATTQPADSIVTFASKDFIHLPDGSTVLLNEGSELSYNASFGRKYRSVKLKGEAYFDIRHDPAHPFIVEAGAVKTKVLGTAFNVNAWAGKVVVTVTRGLVEVGSDEQVFGKIRPDEQITVDTRSQDFVMQPIKADSALVWKNESVVLDGISLAEASEVIGRRFGVKIKIENEAIRKCRVSAWFLHGEDLATMLDLVTGTRQASYTLRNKQVTISGGIGCD